MSCELRRIRRIRETTDESFTAVYIDESIHLGIDLALHEGCPGVVCATRDAAGWLPPGMIDPHLRCDERVQWVREADPLVRAEVVCKLPPVHFQDGPFQ